MASRRKMDISSLLSSSSEAPNGSASALQPAAHQATASTPAATAARQPPRQTHLRRDSLNYLHQAATATATQHQQHQQHYHSQSPSPQVAHQHRRQSQSQSYPPHVSHRSSSASMDALADLATMQHYQNAARQNSAGSLRSAEYLEGQTSPSVTSSRVHPDTMSSSAGDATPTGAMTPSGLRKGSIVGELPLGDAPTFLAEPKTLVVPSLSPEEMDAIADLTTQLSENSYLRAAHLQLVKILHKGFVDHVHAGDGPRQLRDPQQYKLLPELRKARDAMKSRFAMGEELWLEWLHDEAMLAQSAEDCATVVELCKTATQEEAGSSRIWRFFGDWMYFMYSKAHDVSLSYDNSIFHDPTVSAVLSALAWTDEDRLVGREIFTWNTMLDVWRQAISATEWHLDSSHIVWDPHMQILLQDLEKTCTQDRINHLQQLFLNRLCQPHMAWDETFQTFSSFVTRYQSQSYDEIMAHATSQAGPAKQQMASRQNREYQLQRADRDGDKAAEYETMTQYLEWEMEQSKHHRRKNSPQNSLQLISALAERANLRFPEDAVLWEDHLDLVSENKKLQATILEVAFRATRHVPWSGDLWAKRLCALEAAGKSFEELEDVKHLATSTGLLEDEALGSMDDLIKVYLAWCGFLRRRAFAPTSGEDERDMAEVGIASSIENIMNIGNKKYGKDFKGDPYFRIERIFFKFYAQQGSEDEARRLWDKLSITHGDQFSFWDKYYQWEMNVWAKAVGRSESTGAALPLPSKATAVLQKAIRRHDHLDYAEQMVEMYLHHCAQHESIQKVQEARIETRSTSKKVAKRRARETAAQQETFQQQYQAQYAAPTQDEDQVMKDEEPVEINGQSKRKRDKESQREKPSKKARAAGNGEADSDAAEKKSDAASQPQKSKRDREHTTIVIQDLPLYSTEEQLRENFDDCGQIRSINMVQNASEGSATATIEFETEQEAKAAQAKNQNKVGGQKIDVSLGQQTTLYMANYPPEADEAFIRDLAEPFGNVVEIRFPDLSINSSRRFCYVQMLTAAQAQAALRLDGRKLDDVHTILVKLSDPNHKKGREGSQYDEREIYLQNVSWSATEKDIQAVFERYGKIEKVRIPHKPDGGSKGIAFVAFATKEEAKAALAQNGESFMERTMQVQLADPHRKGGQRAKKPSPAVESKPSLRAVAPVSRPKQRMAFKTPKPPAVNGSAKAEQANGVHGKSQDDFRALLNGSR